VPRDAGCHRAHVRRGAGPPAGVSPRAHHSCALRLWTVAHLRAGPLLQPLADAPLEL
jgi:hypothetical protein